MELLFSRSSVPGEKYFLNWIFQVTILIFVSQVNILFPNRILRIEHFISNSSGEKFNFPNRILQVAILIFQFEFLRWIFRFPNRILQVENLIFQFEFPRWHFVCEKNLISKRKRISGARGSLRKGIYRN